MGLTTKLVRGSDVVFPKRITRQNQQPRIVFFFGDRNPVLRGGEIAQGKADQSAINLRVVVKAANLVHLRVNSAGFVALTHAGQAKSEGRQVVSVKSTPLQKRHGHPSDLHSFGQVALRCVAACEA